jgi:SAM-dependent methyltransferase
MRVSRVDFGRTAEDYVRHRAGFPPSFFEHLTHAGMLRPGVRLLDVGTGTGTIARGCAQRGARTVALDPSLELLAQAVRLDREVGVETLYLLGGAARWWLPILAGFRWRGRIRASSGVAAALSPPAVERFDRELQALLAADFPRQPLVIPHRLFVLTCRQP